MSLLLRRRSPAFAAYDTPNERNGALDLLRCQARRAEHHLTRTFADRWRMLAHKLDERVRHTPEMAYTSEFSERLKADVGWRLGDS